MKLTPKTKADLITLEKVMLAVYNRPRDLTIAIFGRVHHPSYLDDQQDLMITNFGRFWSRIDVGCRKRMMDAATEMYDAEAEGRIENY